jgi:hypothetical protein
MKQLCRVRDRIDKLKEEGKVKISPFHEKPTHLIAQSVGIFFTDNQNSYSEFGYEEDKGALIQCKRCKTRMKLLWKTEPSRSICRQFKNPREPHFSFPSKTAFLTVLILSGFTYRSAEPCEGNSSSLILCISIELLACLSAVLTAEVNKTVSSSSASFIERSLFATENTGPFHLGNLFGQEELQRQAQVASWFFV